MGAPSFWTSLRDAADWRWVSRPKGLKRLVSSKTPIAAKPTGAICEEPANRRF